MKIEKDALINLHGIGRNIHVFAITGGPCSGKTTGMARLTEWFTARGYKVIVAPEIPTHIINAGIFHGEEALSNRHFQEMIFRLSLVQEELFLRAAMAYRDKGQKVVLLFDRGLLDGEAYIEPAEFREMIESYGFNHAELSDHRYHGVFHLRTAALGAESYYTLANNTARVERTIEAAREADRKTLEAWQHHAHVRVIDNSTGFDEKISRLFSEAIAVIGDPVPLERERKFLVRKTELKSIPVPCALSDIEQTYLLPTDPKEIARVRSRTTRGGITYYHTVKMFVSPGVNMEVERIITREEYRSHLETADPARSVIRKTRISFFFNDRFFEMDTFSEPAFLEDMAILELEESGESQELSLPPFLDVLEEVTDKPEYSNYGIASGKRG